MGAGNGPRHSHFFYTQRGRKDKGRTQPAGRHKPQIRAVEGRRIKKVASFDFKRELVVSQCYLSKVFEDLRSAFSEHDIHRVIGGGTFPYKISPYNATDPCLNLQKSFGSLSYFKCHFCSPASANFRSRERLNR